MPETVIDLGKRVKSKYPGQYDDLPDDEVGRKVKAKFPGQYDDFVDTPATPAAPPAPELGLFDKVRQLFTGMTPEQGAAAADASIANRKTPTGPELFEMGKQRNMRIAEGLGEVGLGAFTSGAALPVRMAAGATIGGLEGGKTGAAIGAAVPLAGNLFQAMKSRLPSTANAGKLFQQIKGVAGDIPIDTTAADAAVAEAQAVKATGGGSPPAPIREFIKAQKPIAGKFGGVKIEMAPDPITYATGRDFASNASRLSADEALKMSPQMKAKLTQFSLALKSANREAAASVGMGNIYDAAMKEYRQAKTLEDAAEVIKKWAPAALGVGASGIAGGKLGYELWNAH